jgi:hypothetical protein
MKIACLMCAVWISSPLTFPAAVAATGPLEHGPAQSSGTSPAARAQAPGPGPVTRAQGAAPRRAVPQGAVPDGSNAPAASQRAPAAQPTVGSMARSNADRLHSLLRTQARPAAKPPSQPAAGSSRAKPTAIALNRTPNRQGASPVSLSRRSSNQPTPGGLVGAHPPGPMALGGPVMGRATSGRAAPGRAASEQAVLGGAVLGRAATANRAVLDGAQMRRRF